MHTNKPEQSDRNTAVSSAVGKLAFYQDRRAENRAFAEEANRQFREAIKNRLYMNAVRGLR